MIDEQSMYRAHWVVYHQLLKDMAEQNVQLGQKLEKNGNYVLDFVKVAITLANQLEALEKRVAELEAKVTNDRN